MTGEKTNTEPFPKNKAPSWEFPLGSNDPQAMQVQICDLTACILICLRAIPGAHVYVNENEIDVEAA